MNRELLAEAMLGQDAEEFLNSDLGRYLVGAADQEANAAMQQLATVYPWRRRKIQELQNRIWRANSLQMWLAELVVKGRQAIDNLDEGN